MLRDLFGNFVAFEHVLKSFDLKTEFIRDVDEHHNFIGAITMRVNVAFAFEHFDQRIELQVTPRRD